jgi:hypothetical protein
MKWCVLPTEIKHQRDPTFFAGMDGIMKGKKTFKATSKVAVPLILKGMATSKRFGKCCYKIALITLNDSG